MITTAYYFQNCRCGFNHVAILMFNGEVINTNKVHYINRTWESYNGQTARRSVCSKEIKDLEIWAVRLAKQQTGKKRICADVEKVKNQILTGHKYYNDLLNHYNSL
jgi:hypothetical protein